MPRSQFKEAIELIKGNPSSMKCTGMLAESRVVEAESLLSIRFPPMFRQFILMYGTLSFGSAAFLGLREKDNFPAFDDIVKHTLDLRSYTNLSHDVLPIMESGATAYEYGLLLNRPDDNGEPPVIVFYVGYDLETYTPEVESINFASFLLSRITVELERTDD
jgi:antitoxin YobK